jgi:EAL domain-containing protein (putative c-di-GMP-specific phosphodiesterase class I)
MPVRPTATLSDAPAVASLLLLPPDAGTARRLREELAASGIECAQAKAGLHVSVGEIDWRALIETLCENLPVRGRRDTRVAIIPRDADPRAVRKAVAIARSLQQIFEACCDAWLWGLLQRQGLRVHVQPLVHYPPGTIHGYECLVRGLGSGGGLIPPARLFEAAGRLGAAYLLDRHACGAALMTAASLGFASVRYFINVMPAGIDDPSVHVRSTLAAVESVGLTPAQLTFELVDAEAGRDSRRLADLLRCYRDAGFTTSLDDVGAGGASLLRLDDLRPDYVKLDADLCRRATLGGAPAELFAELCAAARRAGATVIAKGLETEEQLRFAIDAGVTVTQGFVHASPAATPLEATREDQVLRQARRMAIVVM